MTQAIATTGELVSAYYDSWNHGGGVFDEARLRHILAADLQFEGPLAGKRTGSDGFIRGVSDIAMALQAFRLVHAIYSGDEAAVMYDCDLTRPAGTFRFAEFFRIDNGKIQQLHLLYDGTEFRKLAAAANVEGLVVDQ